ncbi:hypothetical protein WJ977_06315 [Achromobacter xylosoxidans]
MTSTTLADQLPIRVNDALHGTTEIMTYKLSEGMTGEHFSRRNRVFLKNLTQTLLDTHRSFSPKLQAGS